MLSLCGCRQHEREQAGDTRGTAPGDPPASSPAEERSFAPPERALWGYACQSFDAAVEAGAPPNRLLSHTARHAVELGGSAVEEATRTWALLPPQAMLEELDAYGLALGDEAADCSGLRAHLEHMAQRAATH